MSDDVIILRDGAIDLLEKLCRLFFWPEGTVRVICSERDLYEKDEEMSWMKKEWEWLEEERRLIGSVD